METPFKNDPFCMVWTAYKRLYDKPCEIWWDYHEEDNHKEEYGFTNFPNDGSFPTVIIYSDHPVSIQVETLAHELAQAALKLRRTLSAANPTPVTRHEAEEKLLEEIADVKLCLHVAGLESVQRKIKVNRIISQQAERWLKRLKER